ncbi:inorganic phosphate transporter [Rhizobiales bacterium]|uniref:inorganic phosphate transporter n=1 Tax=Hongsoonwoonella zoysiae TaxID=2821844 RepID=UPI00156119D1|nr:inorganic phosphate transporter [Hongsoonwoonella zoysiae]NRG19522.1 inorganic phosphate transporter [Hongsoonwoonella zoysiae]
MPHSDQATAKPTLDKDLDKLTSVEEATSSLARTLVAPGLALLFLGFSAALSGLFFVDQPEWLLVAAASAIGAYMAINIGANDIANNVGPAVGARAMTLTSALILAAVAESAGALIAGGSVVETVAGGIVDPTIMTNHRPFALVMMAALLASALWINFATWIGAPISTTHSVIGGVLGAGVSAAGLSVVNWAGVGTIAAGWIVSPFLGAIIAILFLAFIKENIIYRDDKLAAARRWVPVLIAVMAGAFTFYLSLKGAHHGFGFAFPVMFAASIAVAACAFALARPFVVSKLQGLDNSNRSLREVFHLPLILSAVLLSFAHGANDVANAVGPLAAIVRSVESDVLPAVVPIPIWVMVIGAFGISFGLLFFGPKLVRMVGGEITKLNPMRAFCVALSAAITVIIASWFGLPVSSTHIVVGAVFGVGLFREWYNARKALPAVPDSVSNDDFRLDFADKAVIEAKRRKLVRRAHLTTILAAWVVTVPVSALLAGVLFQLFVLLGNG